MKRILSAILVCILMVGCVFALASCGGPNKDPEKAKAALEDAEYTVRFSDDEKVLDDDVEAQIIAFDKDGNYISIIYCADKDAAKDAYEEAEEDIDEMKKELAKMLNLEEGKEIDLELGKSGKIVWAGTKDAIKAAK